MRLWSVAAVLIASPALAADKPSAEAVELFEAKIRPVLTEQCYSCHGEKKQSGGLRLDSKAAVLTGGDTGPALVAGKAADSLIVKAIRHEGDLKMPPKGGKLPANIVADFVKWIDAGAADPRDGSTNAGAIDWSKAREFWAFKPVVKPAVPAGPEANPIDRFIRAKLTEKGLMPVGPAEKRALSRRVTIDLTGLPPKPEAVEAFLKDESADAYAKFVDRLLDAPAYGEMQARAWLDVARYAEDQAHTFAVKPYSEAWRYRDWVIRAFNEDLPFDKFVKYQIAADLILGDSPDELRHRAALGFFGLGAQYYKNSDKAKAEADELDDRVDTLTRGFLGLTVSCARCHDHKFDPIPQQDYYSLAGVFWSTKLADVPLAPKAEVERVTAALKKVADAAKAVKDFLQAERTKLEAAKADELPKYVLAAWKLEAKRLANPDSPAAAVAKAEHLDGPTLDRMTKYLGRKNIAAAMSGWGKHLPRKPGDDPPAEVAKMAEAFRSEVKAAVAKPPQGKPADMVTALFGDKGVFPMKDEDVAAGMSPDRKATYEKMKAEQAELAKKAPPPVTVTHGLVESTPTDLKVAVRGNPNKPGDVAPRRFLHILAGNDPKKFTDGSGRKELAEAIANPHNPLTARVFVNRIWQQHFGRGIVGTPSNFGSLGERPTHPELLDWLAATFVESGGSAKALHRQIVLSETYRRAAVPDAKNEAVDADNRYLWRAGRRRLTVEAWRDSLLAVSGRLDPSFGGPTTNLDAADNARRTVYAKVSRHELNGLLRLFDFPDANITAERRVETTVPQQQLFVLNSPFMVTQAKALAARLEKGAPDPAGRIRRAHELAFARPASEEEVALGVKYLDAKDGPGAGQNKLSRWERYCQALLASNEFMYVD